MGHSTGEGEERPWREGHWVKLTSRGTRCGYYRDPWNDGSNFEDKLEQGVMRQVLESINDPKLPRYMQRMFKSGVLADARQVEGRQCLVQDHP